MQDNFECDSKEQTSKPREKHAETFKSVPVPKEFKITEAWTNTLITHKEVKKYTQNWHPTSSKEKLELDTQEHANH